MLSGALLWSGYQLCDALNSVGIGDSTVSACGGNQQTIGLIAISWAAMMLIVWKLLLGRIH